MVELGELIAWKTRGGHRRILASSLDQQLARRKRAMRQKTTQNCIAMGIFRRVENSHELIESIQCWQLKVDMEVSVDSLEGLMKAVSIAPDLIFLDALIPPVEQVRQAILELSGGKTGQRVLLKDLRPKLKGMDRATQDEAFKDLIRSGDADFVVIDDPMSRFEADDAAALHLANRQRHQVYLRR
jgi:hypothetical protein